MAALEEARAAVEIRRALGSKVALCADANMGMTFADASLFAQHAAEAAEVTVKDEVLPSIDVLVMDPPPYSMSHLVDVVAQRRAPLIEYPARQVHRKLPVQHPRASLGMRQFGLDRAILLLPLLLRRLLRGADPARGGRRAGGERRVGSKREVRARPAQGRP